MIPQENEKETEESWQKPGEYHLPFSWDMTTFCAKIATNWYLQEWYKRDYLVPCYTFKNYLLTGFLLIIQSHCEIGKVLFSSFYSLILEKVNLSISVWVLNSVSFQYFILYCIQLQLKWHQNNDKRLWNQCLNSGMYVVVVS